MGVKRESIVENLAAEMGYLNFSLTDITAKHI